MIFAAYVGNGNNVAAKKMDKVIDVAIVPYKYRFPKNYKEEDFLGVIRDVKNILRSMWLIS